MAKKASREKHRLRYPRDGSRPKDWLRFIHEDLFEKCWYELELSDEDLNALQIAIMANVDGYPVLEGTGGVRKIRFAGSHWGKGKSGGARVYYLYVPNRGIVFLLFVHTKNDQESLSQKGKQAIRQLVKEILDHLEDGDYDAL